MDGPSFGFLCVGIYKVSLYEKRYFSSSQQRVKCKWTDTYHLTV